MGHFAKQWSSHARCGRRPYIRIEKNPFFHFRKISFRKNFIFAKVFAKFFVIAKVFVKSFCFRDGFCKKFAFSRKMSRKILVFLKPSPKTTASVSDRDTHSVVSCILIRIPNGKFLQLFVIFFTKSEKKLFATFSLQL
jgi:hypothetical protein